ncbi:MAG: hypothetical protein ACLGHM_03710 [Actinomycetes bacterium]
MTRVRPAFAALAAVVGILCVLLGLVAGRVDRAVTSGEAARTVATAALADTDVVAQASQAIARAAVAQGQELTDSRAGDLAIAALQGPLESLAAQVLSSDQVRTAVAAGITRVETRLIDELTARERATAPFTVGVDIGAELNARLDEVPVVGAFAPDLEIAPVEVEVVDAATFDQVRAAYAGIRFAGDWLAWIGAALLAVGMALSRRRARYAGWSVLGLAVGALAVAFAVGAVAPRALASAMPGGESGGLGAFVSTFLSDSGLAGLTDLMMQVGIVTLVAAIVALVIDRRRGATRDVSGAGSRAEATVRGS